MPQQGNSNQQQRNGQGRPPNHGGDRDNRANAGPGQDNQGRFHNPYNFVPTPSRANIPAGSFAGDYNPLEHQEDHSRLWPDRYTGDIPMILTVKTPLFIAKTPEIKEDNGHKTYDCVDEVPATAIKGMLRSAYEAITNSRYGVFNKEHEKRLGMRLPAESGVVPAKVIRNTQGKLALRLYCGESFIGRDGKPADNNGGLGPQYAAWIPAYVPDSQLPTGANIGHGQKVNACIVLCRHQPNWTFWRVVSMAPAGQKAMRPAQLPQQGQRWAYFLEQGQPVFEQVEGYVVRSGKLISNKHDERLFFNINPNDTEPDVPISAEAEVEYNSLLEDYHKTHKDNTYPPSGRDVVHGRHILQKSTLSEGDFVYVAFNNAGKRNRTIAKMFPVQISRDLHMSAPYDCLEPSLRPAASINHLSPADRLFGWVKQRGQGAWRGKVRIVQMETAHPDKKSVVEIFEQSLPLAILGAPKPSQARFYLGNGNGYAQNNGINKRSAQYNQGKQLRGRKMYVTPKLLITEQSASYWQKPWTNRTTQPTNGHYQEYRQPGGETEKTNQNRSITGWIRPGTEIRFKLRVENMTQEELGGLLLLAELGSWAGASAMYRLGMGKPLGLGCLHVELDLSARNVPIAQGSAWKEYFESLSGGAIPLLSLENVEASKQAFSRALTSVYGNNGSDWKQLPFIKAFIAMANGPVDNLPVHYPRTTKPRSIGNNVSPSFKWFVDNERANNNQVSGLSLPNSWEDAGLPYNPSQA